MAYLTMNRTRSLVICTLPQDYLTGRLREAARYLPDRRDAMEEERRLATEAIELLRSKRGENAPLTAEPANSDQQAGPPQAPARQTRKRRS